VVRKAFKLAQTEKFGATHIDFPEDIAKLPVEGVPLLAQQPYDAEPREEQLNRAADLINGAQMPVIIAGNGVIRGNATEALRRFVAATNIPAANTFMAKGVVPYTDPRALLSVGLQAQDYVSYAIAQADVVVTIGYDLIEYPPERWNPNADKTIVHIDRQPAEVDSHYVLGCGIEADLSITLDELSTLVEPRDVPTIVPKLRELILDEQAQGGLLDGHPLAPQRVLHDVRERARVRMPVATATRPTSGPSVGSSRIILRRVFPAMGAVGYGRGALVGRLSVSRVLMSCGFLSAHTIPSLTSSGSSPT